MTKTNDARKSGDADFRDWDAILERRLRDDLDGFLASADVDFSTDDANEPRLPFDASYEARRRQTSRRRLRIWTGNAAAVVLLASAVWFGTRPSNVETEFADAPVATNDSRTIPTFAKSGSTSTDARDADWLGRLEDVAIRDWDAVAIESARRVGEWTSTSWRAFRPNFDEFGTFESAEAEPRETVEDERGVKNAVERFAFDVDERQNSGDPKNDGDRRLVDDSNEANERGDASETASAVGSVLKNDPVFCVVDEFCLNESPTFAKMVARVEKFNRIYR